MKLTVVASELLSGLRSVQARAKAANRDILTHIRFTAAAGRLDLLGHDMDSSSEAFISAEIEVPGSCAIPAEPLIRLISGVHSAVHVTLELDGHQVAIKASRSRYKLPVMQAQDFPAPLSPGEGLTFKVTKDDISQMLVRPADALDPKDVRPIASGVFLHEEQGALCGAGYAAYNLYRFSTDIPANGFAGVIVPRGSIDEIAKIGAGEMRVSERALEIRTPTRVYCTKLIDGKFPEQYRRMLPPAEGAFIEVDRDEFTACLTRLVAISDYSGERFMDVSVGDGNVSARVLGSADGVETIECDVSDAAGKTFCLPVTQLLKGLKALKGEKLRVYLRNPMDPVRVSDPSEPSAVNVQMPCVSKNVRGEAQAA